MEKKTMGNFISALRRANGLTQKQLAERLNVSDKAVSRWERDDCAPDVTLIPVIADIFGVTSDELLRGERSTALCDAGSQDTSASDKVGDLSAKSRRELKYILKADLMNYRMKCTIAASLSIVGLLIAIAIGIEINGLIGTIIGLTICVGAAVFLTICTIKVIHSVDVDEKNILSEQDIESFKRSVRNSTWLSGSLAAISAMATLPFSSGPLGEITTLSISVWISSALPISAVTAVVCLIVRVFISLKYSQNKILFKKTLLVFGSAILATLLIMGIFNHIAFEKMLFAQPIIFTDTQEFIQYMENPNDGSPMKQDDSLYTEKIIDNNGDVIGSFVYRNDSVIYHSYRFDGEGNVKYTVCKAVPMKRHLNIMKWINIFFCLIITAEAVCGVAFYKKKNAK